MESAGGGELGDLVPLEQRVKTRKLLSEVRIHLLNSDDILRIRDVSYGEGGRHCNCRGSSNAMTKPPQVVNEFILFDLSLWALVGRGAF